MAWTAPRTWTDGELVTKAIMDTHIRDNQLAEGPHLIVRKTADESVTSSVALQDDDSLLMALAANEVWHVKFVVIATSASATPDIKMAFTIPAGATMGLMSPVIRADTDAAWVIKYVASGTAPFAVQLVAGDLTATEISGVVTNSGTAGNLTLQWAQNTSSATATTVKANSTLWAVKLA